MAAAHLVEALRVVLPVAVTILIVPHVANAQKSETIMNDSSPQPIIVTVAGNGTAGYVGDGLIGTSAELDLPVGIVQDTAGDLFIVDSANNVIRKESSTTGILSTVAGNGTQGFLGDGKAATSAELSTPFGLAFDKAGNMYISDFGNNRIRKVSVSTGIISTVAGNGVPGYSGDGGAATSAELYNPVGIAVDSSGNLYIADDSNNRIRKVSASTGVISTVAGDGTGAFGGDGGPAANAQIYHPTILVLDTSGNIYFSDQYNNRIRKIAAKNGIISTVAGDGSAGYLGDGGLATSAELNYPAGVAIDTAGNVYIADTYNCRIRKVTQSTADIATLAGDGNCGYLGDGGLPTASEVDYPVSLTVDGTGDLFIADTGNNRIREVSSSPVDTAAAAPVFNPSTGIYAGAQTVAISDETPGSVIYYTKNGTAPSTASAEYTSPLTVTPAETLKAIATAKGYWQSPLGTAVYTLGKPAPTPLFSPSPGTYVSWQRVSVTDAAANASIHYTLDGTTPTASSSTFTVPIEVTSPTTIKAIAIATGFAQSLTATGTYDIPLPAPLPAFSPAPGTYPSTQTVTIADAAPGTSLYYSTNGKAPTTASTVYKAPLKVVATETIQAFATGDGYTNGPVASATYIISGSASTGIITTFAGDGTYGYSGNNGPATDASLSYPAGVVLGKTGDLYIADTDNNVIRKVTKSGVISTIAGNGIANYAGDGGAATSASLSSPNALALDSSGNLYIADTGNSVIRKVAASGTITTAAGDGDYGYTGDGGQAISSSLNAPEGVAVDSAGNLYIADTYNNLVRKVSTSGIITTFAGNGNAGYSGDGGAAASASLSFPGGVALDSQGKLFIADTGNSVIREVSTKGIISTVAGNGNYGYSGDGGSAVKAALGAPTAVEVDSADDIYITDGENNAIRKVTSSGVIATVAGNGTAGYAGDGGLAINANLNSPNGIAVDATGNLYIGDSNNNVVRKVVPSTGTPSLMPPKGECSRLPLRAVETPIACVEAPSDDGASRSRP